jgi:hypothetical protein
MPNRVCPICRKAFASDTGLEGHVERAHHDQLGGVTPARFIFNMRNGKTGGRCVMRGRVVGCFGETDFNERTKKYNRMCPNQGCKRAYVEEFQKRMLAKYGKLHLLDDPEVQKMMLSRRSISDSYTFRDGSIFGYTGEYEREFLEYMDLALEWPNADLTGPAPFVIPYLHAGVQTYYLPDFYIPSIDLIVEIKGTNAHYQDREHGRELEKDAAARGTGHNFVKITDRNYDEFLSGLVDCRWRTPLNSDGRVTVNEDVLMSCDAAAAIRCMDAGEAAILSESSGSEWDGC